MAIQPVGDYDNVSKAEAANRLRSGKVSVEEKAYYVAKFGEDFVKQAMSVDSTKYEISDEDFNDAKDIGKENAKSSTGHDGKSGSTINAVGDALGGAAAATGGAMVSLSSSGGALGNLTWNVTGATTMNGTWQKQQKVMGARATVILAAALAAKYWIQKPNKDQREAAKHLMDNEFPEGQNNLSQTQEDLQAASEEILELTEEAEDKNEEANRTIEEKKTLFDFYKQQYEALKAKKEAGERLTPDEKALMRSLAPQMETAGTEINDISETTSNEVGELNDKIGEYQDSFDESAENIAEVQGVTDFAEGFDETSRTLMYVEGAGQGLNATGAALAAAQLTIGGPWNWAFAAIGYAAAASSTAAMGQQMSWANEMSQEIDVRRNLQELGTQTTEMYDEELDNYAGNIEVVEDLELEIPEDIQAPTTVEADTADPQTPSDKADGSGQNPVKTRSAGPQANGSNPSEDDNDDKKKPKELQ